MVHSDVVDGSGGHSCSFIMVVVELDWNVVVVIVLGSIRMVTG